MNLLAHAHAAIIHFPVALLLLATVAGLYYLLVRPLPELLKNFQKELRLMIWGSTLLGWLGCVLAVFSGLIAQSNLPPGAPYQSTLDWHTYSGFAQLLLYGGLLYWRWRSPSLTKKAARRIGSAKNPTLALDLLDDRSVRWWLIGLFVIGGILIVASGWNGGRLVYEWGVNVSRG